MTRFVIETAADPHAPALYDGSPSRLPAADGFASVERVCIELYRRHGYLCVRRAFATRMVAAARAEVQDMSTADDPRCGSIYFEGGIRAHLDIDDGRCLSSSEEDAQSLMVGRFVEKMPAIAPQVRSRYVRKFQGFVDDHPPLAALAALPELVALVERLIGGPARIFQDMALVKPPGGREKPWHQDHAYFNVPLATPIVGVWIPLHPVDHANGCMHVLPGSHRLGPQPHFMRRDWQICDSEIIGLTQHYIAMDPGDALLFDAKLAHGTPTNQTAQMRWAVQFHYVPAHVREADDSERVAAFGGEDKDATG